MTDIRKMIDRLKQIPWEAVVWSFALLYLALYQPGNDPHFTVCPLHHLGLEFCPGCGLGRSIAFLFHGHLWQSLAAHPLGIFAVIILPYRIIQLTKNYLHQYGKNY
ncbi:MAG: DUF2752 domain-containing protein [Cyclobacteriaceae bacterium]|nr:DUF2752 domain-containing protein [Cyclobacteriaceae bacterium]